jgi:4-amino-4-deoxy-L-arabinose transferase-like glycosyltransferase
MWGLSRNLRKLGMYTLYGWSVGLLPLAVYGLVRLWRRQLVVRWERALFLLAWVFPSLCFYTLIHMGQQGLVFVFLPVLLLVSARALVRLAEGRGRAALAAGLALLVVVNAALFVALPEYPLGRERFKVLSWDTLCNNDAYYQERFDAIREHFPAESTVIIAVRWRHVEWYLPEYVYLPFVIVGKWEMDAGSALHTGRDERLLTVSELGLRPDDGGQVAVILFDPELRSFNLSSAQVTRVALRGTGGLDIMTLTEEQQLFYGEDRFGLRGD